MLVLARQFMVYCIGGGVSALTNIVITYFLTEFLLVWYLVSYLIGTIVSILVNFSFQRAVTFGVRDNVVKRMKRFAAIMAVTAVLNLVLVYVFTDVFGVWYLFSVVIVTFFVAVMNFCANRIWTFS